MPNQYSELANWNGSASHSPAHPPSSASTHTSQEVSTDTQHQSAFLRHLSSDDSTRDVACIQQMLLVSGSTEELNPDNEYDLGNDRVAQKFSIDREDDGHAKSDVLVLDDTLLNGKILDDNALASSSLASALSSDGHSTHSISPRRSVSRGISTPAHASLSENDPIANPQIESTASIIRSPNFISNSFDLAIDISSDLSPEISLLSLPPSSEPIDSDVQVLEEPTQSRRRAYVLVPPLPSGFMKADYVSNSSVLNGIAQNDLSFNKLSPGTRRFALGLRPTQKRKRKPSATPSPRKRVHKRPHRDPDEKPSTSRVVLGYCTEPVDGFFGTDPFDTLLEALSVDIGEEIPYNDMKEQDFLSLRISLRRTRPSMPVQEPSHSLSSSPSQILASLSPPPETFGVSGRDLDDVQDFSYITPWSAGIQEHETYGFSQPLAESSRLSTAESKHSETPYGEYFGNGTIDPSVLGGGPILPPEQSPSPSPPPPVIPAPHNEHPPQDPTSTHTSELSRTSASRSPTLSQRHPPKGKRKVKPSQEILAAAGSIRRKTPSASSSGVRDRRPSTRVREALQQADYELTDDDADGETVADDDDFEPLASLSSAKRERSLSQGRPKPSRKFISTLKVSTASGKDVEGTYCHQCRCKTKGRKMQCAAYRADDIPCELRFCERCITRRYPDLKFNPDTENFICPKCSGYCNCTACCHRRGEEYISSRGNGPSPFLLLSQSRNTTALPPSLSSSPPLKSHSTSAQKGPSTPTLAVPPGMFWGTVYGVNGERIGAGVVSEDQQVIITNEPPPSPPLPAPPTSRSSRKVMYVGQPPRRKDTTSPPTVNGTDKPENNVRPAKRAFIGDKIALISGTLYKSLEEHFAFERASSPLTPIHGSSDPVQPTTVEVGFLLAQAMQQMGQ